MVNDQTCVVQQHMVPTFLDSHRVPHPRSLAYLDLALLAGIIPGTANDTGRAPGVAADEG